MQMTAEEVSKLIANEVAAADESRLARLGVELSRCLIKPERVTCTNTFPEFRGGQPFEAWLVFEETPPGEDGYRIIFDEELGEFGLACGPKLRPVFIGWHGTFLDTVQGM